MSSFKTPKGTELPLLDLRGKPYLQVAHRIVWFREDHPGAPIETEIVQHTDQFSVVRAVIRDKEGRIISTATKKEHAKDFGDHLEKAETGSIGRALGFLGYGTQFAVELEEGERIVDSPIQPARRPAPRAAAPAPAAKPAGNFNPNKPVTEPQIKRAFAISKAKGIPDSDVKAFVTMAFNKDSMHSLTMGEINTLFKRLEAGKLSVESDFAKPDDIPF